MKFCLLAIESSCDDTGASVLIDGKIHSNVIFTQSIHQKYGGVVPEMASRMHMQAIVPVANEALFQAGIAKEDLKAVAFTRGPGLMGSLLVGSSFAKSLAGALKVPLIAVNHMEAHVLAHFIDEPYPEFPFLCLTVSGGHTQIVLVRDYLDLQVIGLSVDDAAGEAFDKTAKMLGLPYPGGPLIDKYGREGNPLAFKFPEPVVGGLNFSFSGLKTSVLHFLQDNMARDPEFIKLRINDICASIQETIINILVRKMTQASLESGIKQIAIAGGVSANSRLRIKMQEAADEKGWKLYIPQFQYCTDNAAMIAIAGYYKFQAGDFTSQEVIPVARWRVGDSL